MASLANKSALLIGAGSGIGRACALLMARRGAAVMVADIVEASARSVAREITAAGGRSAYFAVDIAVEDQIVNLVAATVKAFGGIDILLNNAALLDPKVVGPDAGGSVTTLDALLWDKSFDVNVRGTMLAAKHAIPEMLKRDGGSIINTSSIASMHGQPSMTAYGVSKAAVNMLGKYIATAYGRQGIRCNAVAPGYISTAHAQANTNTEFQAMRARHTLTPFLGEPNDVAYAVAFLASDEARYITGQVIAVDGGVTAHSPWYADEMQIKAASKI